MNMDWGVIATALGTVIAAYITVSGVRNSTKTSARAAELNMLLAEMRAQIDRLQSDLDKLKAEHKALGDERDTLRSENASLRGTILDQAELLDDWRAIGDWITGGATPPTPSLSWRILQERAAHERTLDRQRNEPHQEE